MSEAGRRMGGRAARRALRAAPIPEEEKAVRPGMQGGRYKPLSDDDVNRIHHAVLDVLENIGLSQGIPSCVDLLTGIGCTLSPEGRLLFPRALVEDTIANAARNFVLHGRDQAHDMELSGNKVYFGTAGAAVHIADCDTREYRESTLADLYDVARLVDSLEHIHFYQRSLVARDMTDPRELDINTAYACLSGTNKHVGTSFVLTDYLDETMDMLHLVAGGEKQWRERPFVSMSNCFVVPPLRFAEDACGCLEAGVRAGMPILLLAAGQAGATSPAALAGAVVQEVAEVLAGLVYVNAIKPGHPAIFGTWPFVSDLRTGAMSGGSGEQAVLMAACGQMGRYYDLPTGIAAGMADAKLPDAQSGFEKSYTNVLAGHSGANLVYESAGMHGSLLGCCFESFVIDNDMLGAIQRTIRGIEVTEDSLSIESIRDVCIGGPNHFLGHSQTMELMQRDYIYPEIGDRTSPKEWGEQGSTDMLQRAQKRLRELMTSHYPQYIDPELDAQIRQQFPIRLPPELMKPGNDRW
ncbi:MAG: trimethylamine methyltransferase family protein [Gammaproteobacteria bacterium]|nr:trimethylamine methyltransferase family protein [Gammaproteobacteria bacterium]